MRIIILTLLSLFSLTSIAESGDYCYRPRTYYTPYNYNNYYTPYNYNNYYYYEKKYYPVVFEAPVSPDYYYSTAGYLQNQLMMKMLNMIENGSYKGSVQVTKSNQKPTNPNINSSSNSNIRQNSIEDAAKTLEKAITDKSNLNPSIFQEPKLVNVIKNNCVACHGSSPRKNNLSLMTPDETQLANLSLDKIWKAYAKTNSGDMPQDGHLEDSDVKLFYDWAKAIENNKS